MLPTLQNLLDLQTVDARLLDLRARHAAYARKFSDLEARVAAAKAELERARASHTNALKERRKYELDVESWKEKAHKFRDQAYQVKTNEAFKALQHEIQMAEDEIAKAEDRLLEQMVAGEEYDLKIKTAEKALQEAEEFAQAESAKLEAEKAGLEKELAQAEEERKRAVGGIPEELLDHYHRIARKHGGVAMAEVRDEKCGACGMRVRPQVFQEMRRSENTEIFHCETCTRILYFIEPPAPAGRPVAVAAPASADSVSARRGPEA